jgi:hypothetical protein
VHLDHLAVQRSQLRTSDGDVLDDALQLDGGDEDDRVPDRVPALDEHREAGEDVDQETLRREARHDEHERHTGDRRQLVDAPGHLGDREDDCGGECRVGDRRTDDAHERLPPLQVGNLAGRLQVGVARPPVVPREDSSRDEGAHARDEERDAEEGSDDHDPAPERGQGRVGRQEIDDGIEHGGVTKSDSIQGIGGWRAVTSPGPTSLTSA